MEENGFQKSIEGAKRYLREWAEIMKPEYLMASTPHDFTFPEENVSNAANLCGFHLRLEALPRNAKPFRVCFDPYSYRAKPPDCPQGDETVRLS